MSNTLRTSVVGISVVIATLLVLVAAAFIFALQVHARPLHAPAAPIGNEVDVASDLSQANGHSGCASISADGRYIVFTSLASNLISDDTNKAEDLFLHDRVNGSTIRIFAGTAPDTNNVDLLLCDAAISADGNYVVFSYAVRRDGQSQVYLYDRKKNAVTQVSKLGETEGDCISWGPSVSYDASKIAFVSCAKDLVPGDLSQGWRVVIYDRNSGIFSHMPEMYNCQTSPALGQVVALSADGSHLATTGFTPGMALGYGGSNYFDMFVYDLSDCTENSPKRVSVTFDGDSPNNSVLFGYQPTISALSATGKYVLFISAATNIVTPTISGKYYTNLYIQEMTESVVTGASLVSVSSQGEEIGSSLDSPSMSGNGQYVVFTTSANKLAQPQPSAVPNIFFRDLLHGETKLVSMSLDGGLGNNGSRHPQISQDGRWVVFESLATNLVSNDTNDKNDIFVRDLVNGQTSLISKPTPPLFGRVTFRDSVPAIAVSVNVDGKTTTTDDLGEYWFSDLPPGRYTVTPSKPGVIFEPPARTIEVPVTQSIDFDALCPQSKWLAEYYAGGELTGTPVTIRCEDDKDGVDHYWPSEATVGGSQLLASSFAARWTQTVRFETAGIYQFRIFGDDRFRLFIDASQPISDWNTGRFREKSALVELGKGWHTLTLEYANTDGDAIVDLGWYLCPKVGSACDLDVTPQYQTAYNDDPMPKQCLAKQDETATIARWGCNITSIAMALQPLGIQTTPRELNDWLSDNKGYVQNPKDPCDGNLASRSVIEVFALEKFNKQIHWNPVAPATSIAEVIRSQEPPLPVILHSADGHFTLATSVVNINGQETVGISDPWHSWRCSVVADTSSGPSKTKLACGGAGTAGHVNTLAELVAQEGTTVPVGYYAPLVGDRTASLSIRIFGAEALLTDADGHLVGYNPAIGQVIVEKSNASYGDETITPLNSPVSPTSTERTIYLGSGARGTFTISLYPLTVSTIRSAEQQVQITIVAYDENLGVSETTYSAIMAPGAQLKLDYFPGQSPQLTPQAPNNLHLYLPSVSR